MGLSKLSTFTKGTESTLFKDPLPSPKCTVKWRLRSTIVVDFNSEHKMYMGIGQIRRLIGDANLAGNN